MRQTLRSILLFLCLLFASNGVAQDQVPSPLSTSFPNIRASLDNGFFILAEQQAQGVVRGESSENEKSEAVLLLAHALWGQKRYSEMIDLLGAYEKKAGDCILECPGAF